MPYRSYETPETAAENAKRLAAAGAEFVKAEGGREIIGQIHAIIAAGIPFCGHLGMLPQHVLEEGGYHVKGKKETEREALLENAKALANAGAFAIVLEIVTPPVAKEITRHIPIPTIGIGSGGDCDGQILVTPDLIGMFPWFTPRFVKPRLCVGAEIKAAVTAWKNSVQSPGGAQ
jgi:3-methyl-2-oxobutanoate hydroxymethyltransferase